MRLRIDLLMFALALVAAQAWAGQSGPGQESPDPPDDADTIDEITVVAPKTEMALRAEIIHAEEAMFDLFNSINTERDFHVICDWENRSNGTISRLKEWRCVSLGEKQILWKEFGGVTGVDAVATARSLQPLTQGPIRRHREAMRKHMIELAEENPELANAIYRRAALERDLAEARARKRQ